MHPYLHVTFAVQQQWLRGHHHHATSAIASDWVNHKYYMHRMAECSAGGVSRIVLSEVTLLYGRHTRISRCMEGGPKRNRSCAAPTLLNVCNEVGTGKPDSKTRKNWKDKILPLLCKSESKRNWTNYILGINYLHSRMFLVLFIVLDLIHRTHQICVLSRRIFFFSKSDNERKQT